MKLSKCATLTLIIALALMRSIAAWGNGVDFFKDALIPGPKPLVYTGRITDRSGEPIANTQVYVTLDRLAIAIEVHGDSDGRYRTHDIRKALGMVGEMEVNTSDLGIFVKRAYYNQVSPKTTAVPEQDHGEIVINFIMERN